MGASERDDYPAFLPRWKVALRHVAGDNCEIHYRAHFEKRSSSSFRNIGAQKKHPHSGRLSKDTYPTCQFLEPIGTISTKPASHRCPRSSPQRQRSPQRFEAPMSACAGSGHCRRLTCIRLQSAHSSRKLRRYSMSVERRDTHRGRRASRAGGEPYAGPARLTASSHLSVIESPNVGGPNAGTACGFGFPIGASTAAFSISSHASRRLDQPHRVRKHVGIAR